MNVRPVPAIILALVCLPLSACNHQGEEVHEEHHKVVATTPQVKPVVITERYVCQIHSKRHIKVRALEMGYLEEIPIREGQPVKEGDVLFTVLPNIYKAKLDAENAEARLAQIEFNNTKRLSEHKVPVVSDQEVALAQAKLAKATAKAELAGAEFNFTKVKAPFDGIVDRLLHQQGSLVQEGEILTTLSDNSVMWVYFNVPEKQYLQYQTSPEEEKQNMKIELLLANGEKFDHLGKIGAIEADFNNETGNIAFRADFPNEDSLLRHGQTGTVLISRVQKDALVIPQRATFEILAKQYVYVIDKDDVAHQREIVPQKSGVEDLYVIQSGLTADDRIVLEGIRQIRDGAKIEYEERHPDEVVAQLKYHAE